MMPTRSKWRRGKSVNMRWLAGEELADCGISPADLTLAFIHYFDTLSLLRLRWKSPIITLALCFTAPSAWSLCYVLKITHEHL